jgi:hypothetical protein
MSLLPTELYVESGYLLDSDYVGGIADPKIIFTRYYDEDYAETGYVLDEGVVSSLSADLTLAIQEASASLASSATLSATVGILQTGAAELISTVILGTLDDGDNLGTVSANTIASAEISLSGAFAPTIVAVATKSGDVLMQSVADLTATVSRIAGATVLLDYQADLDAQAARTAGIAATVNTISDINILPAAIREGSADFVCVSQIAANGGLLNLIAGDLSSEFTSTANAIEYVSRFTNNDRPVGWSFFELSSTGSYFSSNDFTFDNTIYKYGTHSLAITQPNNFGRTDVIDLEGFGTVTGNFVFEFWYRAANITAADDVFIAELSNADFANFTSIDRFGPTPFFNTMRIYREADVGRIAIRVADKLLIGPLGSQINDNTWYHMAAVFINRTLNFYLNGTLTFNEPLASINLTTPRIHLINDCGFNNTRVFFDNVRLATNTTDFQYNADIENDSNTQVLARFDGNLADDTSLTFEGAANLNSTANITPTITGTANAAADLTAFYSQLTAAGRVSDFFVNADAVATITTLGDRIRAVEATLASESNIAAEANRIVDGSAALNSTAAVEITSTITADTDVSVNSAFAAEITSTKITDTVVDLNSSAQFTVVAARIAQATSNLDSEFNVNITSEVVKSITADLNSTVAVAVTGGTIKNASVELAAFYSQVTAAGAVGDFFVNADASASITATVAKTAGAGANVTATVGFAVELDRIRNINSNINTEFDIDCAVNTVRSGAAELSSQSNIAVTGARIRFAQGDLNATAEVIADVGKIPGQSFEIDSEFNITAEPNIIRGIAATLTSNTAISALGGAVFEGSADLTGFVSIISINKILHIDQVVYVIPKEQRTFAIRRETRSYRIQKEIRTHSIQGEQA